MKSVIVHYQEIALKGGNRPWFISRLVRNLRALTADLGVAKVRALMGRIELELEPHVDWVALADRLSRVFGLANFARAGRVASGDVDEIAAAVLADLAASVVALESDAELAARASQALADLGADNAVVVEGDLAAGIAGQGPYDVIILNGAVTKVPETLTGQLAEGGRLAAVVVENGVGRIRVFKYQHGDLSSHDICDAAVPVLPGFAPKAGFSF